MKRILIISNDGISDKSSNGRTMKQLLRLYDKDKVAQFYLHGAVDADCCSNSYQISDEKALRAFLGFLSKYVKKVNRPSDSSNSGSSGAPVKRSCKNMFLREIIWRSHRWWTRDFENWLNNFNPEAVVFQAGDCPFMCEIAYRITKKFNIPLIIYNSESYVIRKTLFHGANEKDIFHKIIKKQLSKQFDKLMALDPYCIYIIDELRDEFEKKYPGNKKNTTLRTASTAEVYEYIPEKAEGFTASYCGNLGGGRAKLLLEFAKEMERIKPSAKLIVCGKDNGSEAISRLNETKNVSFLGFVSYEKVCEVMRNSDLVLHCESSERIEARYYAFSTKIADCLRCGIPFMVLASEKYPFSQYLIRNNAAFVCDNTEKAHDTLKKIIDDLDYRCSCLKNARRLSEENHNSEKNAKIFCTILENS